MSQTEIRKRQLNQNTASPDIGENAPLDRSFRQQLLDLSNIDSPRALNSAEIGAVRHELRGWLVDSGFDLTTIENSPELIKALQGVDLDNLHGSMGPAVAVAMDGPNAVTDPAILSDIEKTPDSDLRSLHIMAFRAIAQKMSEYLPSLASGTRHSKRRGLEKFFGYTLAFAINVPGTEEGAITAEKYAQNVNWIVGAAIERPLKRTTDKAKKHYDKSLSNEDYRIWKESLSKLKSVRENFGIPSVKDTDARTSYSKFNRVPVGKLPEFIDLLEKLGKTPKSEVQNQFPQVGPDQITRVDLLGNDFAGAIKSIDEEEG